MRRKYMEVTRELRRELKKMNEELVLSRGVVDTDSLDKGAGAFPLQRRRDG